MNASLLRLMPLVVSGIATANAQKLTTTADVNVRRGPSARARAPRRECERDMIARGIRWAYSNPTHRVRAGWTMPTDCAPRRNSIG